MKPMAARPLIMPRAIAQAGSSLFCWWPKLSIYFDLRIVKVSLFRRAQSVISQTLIIVSLPAMTAMVEILLAIILYVLYQQVLVA